MKLSVVELESKCPKCGTSLSGEGEASICPKCAATMILGRTVQYFGDYELLEEIGRGGMGVVYQARQSSLNRSVALKMMIQGGFASPEFVRRFQNEAESAASLQHPNIVAIYEVGEIEGLHYFSMDYIDGPSLAEVVREGPLPAERAARYVELVAEAIHHAHQRGILHRDLKPSNVLIDPFDQPRVTDFGLAKRLDHDLGPTFTGQVLGSPGYMPPEQAAGRHSLIGVTSDVYSLGAILYYLLTGQAPFADGTAAEVLVRVQKEEPRAPRTLSSGVPRDLETICLKCLRKQPADRYASAAELAADLRHWQKGEEIAARPQRTGGKLRSWCGEHPLAVFLAGLATLVIVELGIGGWWFISKAPQLLATSPAATSSSADSTSSTSEEVKGPVDSQLADDSMSASQVPSGEASTAAVWPAAIPAVVTPLSSQQTGQRWTNSLGMIFVPVPGTEVLFGVWDVRVQDYGAYSRANRGVEASWRNPGFQQGLTHPVVKTSWNDANAFCAWLTRKEQAKGKISASQIYRLPADWEWSVAVGLSESREGTPKDKDEKTVGVYPWGTQWPPPPWAGNYSQSLTVDAWLYTSPVGSFAANRHGLYDMGGNVWQWCEDSYDGQSGNRVLRGGSWNAANSGHLLSSCRYENFESVSRISAIGFRCVLAGEFTPIPAKLPAVALEANPALVQPEKAKGPYPAPAQRWTNSLDMIFVPVPGTAVQFSIWDTRVQDYQVFAIATGRAWGKPSFEQGPTHPAVKVSWDDANAFCAWLTERERRAGTLKPAQEYRLPREWEWSQAVGNTKYFWGDKWPPPSGAGNYHSRLKVDSYQWTSPVGSFAANRYGIYDLGGNVWEWCEDWWHGGEMKYRVIRGASWGLFNSPRNLSSNWHDGHTPSYRYEDGGFRCVLAGGGVSAP